MAHVFLISSSHTSSLYHSVHLSSVRHLLSFTPLIRALFKDGNSEKDVSRATVVIIDTQSPSHTGDSLDSLPYEEKYVFLHYFFSHTNLIVVPSHAFADSATVAQLDSAVRSVGSVIGTRISRVAVWTGTSGFASDDAFESETLKQQFGMVVPTMTRVLHLISNLSEVTENMLKSLRLRLLQALDFKLILSQHSDKHLSKLCHCVGHWAFPAHELSNDDLVYCVYLMLDYAVKFVVANGAPSELVVPTSNKLLALAFMTRDTYKKGNQFHNFRHAVDVLQACFFYLIRLKCLPVFEQYETDPKADETHIFNGKKSFMRYLTLVPIPEHPVTDSSSVPLLTPIQSLGLLVAALGHDVGHPGVTNAFMIKHSTPTSQIYNERSVLEMFHSSVFTNKILKIAWPSLLQCNISTDSNVNICQLITSSILATDMAEHFEYIQKLKEMPEILRADERVKLISSLLIKCADISNVTRPLRVSSLWALIMLREFEEVDKLEKIIRNEGTVELDVDYPQLPLTIGEILGAHPCIHKGQLFFINTYAEGLFNSVLDHFKELKYTSDIIAENKLFWQTHAEKLS